MVELDLYPLLIAASLLVAGALAEWIHSRRVARLARLAFGPAGRPAPWARFAPAARVLAFGLLGWGLATLYWIEPRRHFTEGEDPAQANDPHHVLLALDVSPSMRLLDAGPEKKESRIQRARRLMESFFERIPVSLYRVSVVAFYNGAKPVVVDTKDFEVVRNILGDLPMHYAFPAGKTKLFAGLEEAAKLAKPWNPRSTTLIVVSDGDTVPATGMPQMPASIRSVIVVGVGDANVGKFIDGRQSRQDVTTLKQVAARLRGSFHNGNERQLPTSLIADAVGMDAEELFRKLTRREYALIACALAGTTLAFLPLALHYLGSRWKAGAPKPALSLEGESPRPGYRALRGVV